MPTSIKFCQFGDFQNQSCFIDPFPVSLPTMSSDFRLDTRRRLSEKRAAFASFVEIIVQTNFTSIGKESEDIASRSSFAADWDRKMCYQIMAAIAIAKNQ